MCKHSAFLVRNEGMSHEEFLDHWRDEHVPIAREIPGVVRYARVVPIDPPNSAPSVTTTLRRTKTSKSSGSTRRTIYPYRQALSP